jgi:hypothetical protein
VGKVITVFAKALYEHWYGGRRIKSWCKEKQEGRESIYAIRKLIYEKGNITDKQKLLLFIFM